MPDLLVSKLRSGATGLPSADRVGWISSGLGAIGSLSANLDMATEFPPGVFVDAIPDLWGKALLFAYALSDPRHQFYKPAVGAYRGFLTMLALRKRHGYKIEVRKIQLTQGQVGNFLQVARRLAPHVSMTKSWSWTDPYIFLLENEVVGISSPLTIIAPREGPDLSVPTARNLANGFRFTDPLKTLSPTQAADVAAWINNVWNITANLPQTSGTNWQNAVCSVLSDYRADLLSAAGTQQVPALAMDSSSLAIADATLASLIGKALPLSADNPPSDVELVNLRQMAAKHLLIIDSSTPGSWGLLPSGVHIHGGITYDNVANQALGVNRSMVVTHALPDAWEWRQPEDFLLPTLAVISSKVAFKDVRSISGTDSIGQDRGFVPIPPIAPLLTEYVTPEYIAQNAAFNHTGSGVEFSIDLPVRGGKITARRTYPLDQLTYIDLLELPIVEVWPKTAEPRWKLYYTFCSNVGIHPRYIVQPLGVSYEKHSEDMDDGFPEVLIAETHVLPPFLGFYESKAIAGSGRKERLVGIVIPYYEPAQHTPRAPAEIGFDFGTTNTEVYIRVGDSAPERLAIQTSTAQICIVDEALRLGAMHRHFVPPCGTIDGHVQTENSPFLSLVRRRRGKEEAAELRPVVDTHMLFYRAMNSKDQLADRNLHAYLKWQPEMNADRRAFLFQVALNASIEAIRRGASSIKFRYSYPTAFRIDMKESLRGAWHSIIADLANLLPVQVALDEIQTESVAAAYYFSAIDYDAPALSQVGSVVIDLGGGTSDVSVWGQGRLQLQSSIRLSGREIFLDALESNRQLSSNLLFEVLGADRIFQKSFDEESGERFYRTADALLRVHGNDLINKLYLANGRPDYTRLRSEVALRLGALLYYVGLMIKATEVPTIPRVYLGGNGCRILHWLSPPEYSKQSPLHRFLSGSLWTGAGPRESSSGETLSDDPEKHEAKQIESDVHFVISRDPKSEAARGLLTVMDAELNVGDGERVKLVAGEEFYLGESSRKSTTLLTAKDLADPSLDVHDLGELRTYLELYNANAMSTGDVVHEITNVDEVVSKARDEVRNWYMECRAKDEKKIQVDPFFVRGLLRAIRYIRWSEEVNVAGK